jgi:hypothetical protein
MKKWNNVLLLLLLHMISNPLYYYLGSRITSNTAESCRSSTAVVHSIVCYTCNYWVRPYPGTRTAAVPMADPGSTPKLGTPCLKNRNILN